MPPTPSIATRTSGRPVVDPTSPPFTVGLITAEQIDIRVNGHRLGPGSPIGAWVEGDLELRMAFPVAMDRASTELALNVLSLPEVSFRWPDDRTVIVTVSELTGSTTVRFDPGVARSADGGSLVDGFDFTLPSPEVAHIDIFRPAELLPEPAIAQPARSYTVRAGDGLSVSPDGERAILFDGLSPRLGPPPRVVRLATGERREIGVPASAGWLAFADWIPGGRILLVGREVWLTDSDGGNLRSLFRNDWANGLVWRAFPSPSGRRVAMWSPVDEGRVAIADLERATVTRLASPFRRCAQDGGVSLVWSPDETRVAGVDCEPTAPGRGFIRFVDLASDRTLRTVSGFYAISSFGDGYMLHQPLARIGGGVLAVVFGWDGAERHRFEGGELLVSPDRTHALHSGSGLVPTRAAALIELATGRSTQVAFPITLPRAWTPAGLIVLY
jgi:hypothetical protein